jgi:hypothetical protein
MPENEREPTKSAFRKGMIGFLFTVLAGVLIWWLTITGGPLDPKNPDIHLTALSVYPVLKVGTSPAATASVENSGDGTATNCRMLWSPFTSNPKDSPYPATTDFSLGAGERKDLTLTTTSTYSQRGSYEMSALLICETDESRVVGKTVVVR